MDGTPPRVVLLEVVDQLFEVDGLVVFLGRQAPQSSKKVFAMPASLRLDWWELTIAAPVPWRGWHRLSCSKGKGTEAVLMPTEGFRLWNSGIEVIIIIVVGSDCLK